MTQYIVVSLASGLLFALLDGILNINPLAQRLHLPYQPIARKSMNLILAVGIDIGYGFVMAGLYLLLYHALPGQPGVVRAVWFAVLVWILRVVMSVLSHWVMFEVPASSHLYDLGAGLIEMLILALFYAATLRPAG